jgi:hypothetical protein
VLLADPQPFAGGPHVIVTVRSSEDAAGSGGTK